MVARGGQSLEGSGNVQLSGNNNTVLTVLSSSSGALSKTRIYELLEIVVDSDIPKSKNYSLKPPAYIESKLVFNRAPKYINKFRNHADEYNRLSEVIKEFPNSEDIVKKLNDLFLDTADFTVEGIAIIGDGDSQLDAIGEKLKHAITSDRRFGLRDYTEEDVEQFCIALMEYGVSKCKILIDLDIDASD